MRVVACCGAHEPDKGARTFGTLLVLPEDLGKARQGRVAATFPGWQPGRTRSRVPGVAEGKGDPIRTLRGNPALTLLCPLIACKRDLLRFFVFSGVRLMCDMQVVVAVHETGKSSGAARLRVAEERLPVLLRQRLG
jgi:hypothetical protein